MSRLDTSRSNLFELPPAAAVEAAKRVRLLALDVDGTLTDGKLTFASDGVELKSFDVHDGMGLRLLRDAGIAVAMITARSSDTVARRASDLGIGNLVQGSKNKADSLRAVCAELGIAPLSVAFMGDDLPDLPAMAICGLAIAPANAHAWVRTAVAWTTRASGGSGAVREVCDGLLAAQGLAAGALERFRGA